MSRYTPQTRKSTSPSQAIEDSKKKNTRLKDNSWIRRNDDEDEAVDRDPNFGKSILSRYKSNETLPGVEPEETKPTSTRTSTTSVHALTKRFGGSQDDLKSSTLPSSRTTSSYTKSSYSSLNPKSPTTTTTSKTTITEEPKTNTSTTTVTKNGKTTETTITTTQSVHSPVVKSPTKTETFTERVKSSSKEPQYTSYSPTRTTKVTEKTVTSSKETEDKLFDTLIPSSVKDDYAPKDSKTTITTTETVVVKGSPDTDSKKELFDTLLPKSVKDDVPESKTTVSSTETVTVKTSNDGNGIKTTTTTRTSSTAEDDLYDTLLPKSITSGLSSPISSSIKRREVFTVDSSKGGESPTLTSPTSTRRSITSYSSYDDIPSTRTTSYTISTKPSDDYSSDHKSYSYSKPDSSYEYTSITSPSTYTSITSPSTYTSITSPTTYTSITSPTTYTTTSYRTSSRSDENLSDPIYSRSSIKNKYASSDRTVHEKDLCTSCRKPFTGDAKMVLDDMKINCHASCFNCDVCNCSLGNLKAGDSMWIYKRMVHCENCFETTREKWRR